MKCTICNRLMIPAQIYDPEGIIPLYGGYKKYDKSGNLISWFICKNPICQNKEKQRNEQ